MKLVLSFLLLVMATALQAQVWKVLPKGVRIFGYRNVTTSKITSNFNRTGQETSLGSSFRVDGNTLNQMTNGSLTGVVDASALNALVVGEYSVDAQAQFNFQGSGFVYGITDKLIFYGELAYYNAQVKAKIKRTAGNTYEETAAMLERSGGMQNQYVAENLRNMIDANAGTIQSVIQNHYKYKPIGNWYGKGYGDMETGVMYKAVDRGVWGLLLYPGVVLPTGRQDDPDILQDVGFGDGQFDFFGEMASGYVVNDNLSFGAVFRYTYQAPTSKTLRVPDSRDFQLSNQKGQFDVKYGDKVNLTMSSTLRVSDWVSFTPVYRFLYQGSSQYSSQFGSANDYLAYNSDKIEHQGQLTTSFSSITPFLKKEFLLPAQININLVKTLSGKNVPNQSRFEVEFRMLF